MATGKENKSDRARGTAQETKDNILQGVGLLALPLLAFQRNMLNIVKTGIEEAGLLKPVRTLAESELHALFMILDPKAQWRNSLGLEIEKKLRETLDRAVPKLISGSVSVIDAQQEILTSLIETLDAARKNHPKGPKK